MRMLQLKEALKEERERERTPALSAECLLVGEEESDPCPYPSRIQHPLHLPVLNNLPVLNRSRRLFLDFLFVQYWPGRPFNNPMPALPSPSALLCLLSPLSPPTLPARTSKPITPLQAVGLSAPPWLLTPFGSTGLPRPSCYALVRSCSALIMDLWAFICDSSFPPLWLLRSTLVIGCTRRHPGCFSLRLHIGLQDLLCCPVSSAPPWSPLLSAPPQSVIPMIPSAKSPPWLLPPSTLPWAYVLGFPAGGSALAPPTIVSSLASASVVSSLDSPAVISALVPVVIPCACPVFST
ncbi:hypothetical protein DPX16_9255 [Anabarilius grahami]|uniref:Uncharacterized protein n=1 Tax=Anabarilius grahami TaxID=495550 RepID=A0A3N0Y6D1_ANAGA|nr:hypothetical protein DPX16_9255 [Anabarilius grahami]